MQAGENVQRPLTTGQLNILTFSLALPRSLLKVSADYLEMSPPDSLKAPA
jgi:hypothetical protein